MGLIVTASLGVTLLVGTLVGPTAVAAAPAGDRPAGGACADVALLPTICHFREEHAAPPPPVAPDREAIRLLEQNQLAENVMPSPTTPAWCDCWTYARP